MPITINEPELERKLEKLALILPVKGNKHSVTVGIIRHALRNGPEAARDWLHNGSNDAAITTDPGG